MAATVLQGVAHMIRNIRRSGRLDLRWSASELHSPSITHGPRGSIFCFSLSPINDDTYRDLSAARRYNIPVRLVSLNRPLNLVIVHLDRVGEEVQVTGRLAPQATLQ